MTIVLVSGYSQRLTCGRAWERSRLLNISNSEVNFLYTSVNILSVIAESLLSKLRYAMDQS